MRRWIIYLRYNIFFSEYVFRWGIELYEEHQDQKRCISTLACAFFRFNRYRYRYRQRTPKEIFSIHLNPVQPVSAMWLMPPTRDSNFLRPQSYETRDRRTLLQIQQTKWFSHATNVNREHAGEKTKKCKKARMRTRLFAVKKSKKWSKINLMNSIMYMLAVIINSVRGTLAQNVTSITNQCKILSLMRLHNP